MATQRSMDAITETAEFTGRSVLDLGCGDGFYTARIWDIGRPRGLVALDAALAAVRVAASKLGERPGAVLGSGRPSTSFPGRCV